VYDKQEPEGEDFEEARPEIVSSIKEEKGEDYEPTEDEIAERFKRVKVRQMLIRKTKPGAAQERIAELVRQASVQINNPYILAYQALYADRLQPPQGMGFAELKTLAENSAAGEGYDYSLIQVKLDKGKPQLPGAETGDTEPAVEVELTPVDEEGTDPPAEGVEAAADGEPAEGADGEDAGEAGETPEDGGGEDAAAEVETSAQPPAGDETPVSIYALGIGLLKLAVQEQETGVGYLPYYMMAKTYLDWLDDEDAYEAQPLDRPVAREEIEEDFAMVAERFEYSPLVHAYRGLNLAWLERETEARESLELAEKYTPSDDQHEAYDIMIEAYGVLDDDAKATQLEEHVAQIRQEKLQQQIQQQMAQQEAQGGQGAQTPFSPGAGQPGADTAADDEAPADDGEGAQADGTGATGDEAEAGDGQEAVEDDTAGDEATGDEPAGGEPAEE
jgi:hypothetical protein